MQPKDIISKVKKIEIRTRCLVDELTAGSYHSIFKGKGVEFAEVREYIDGDDVRDIDWNVTAKMNFPFVKQFTEERELNVFLLVDVSNSNFVVSNNENYRDLTVELVSLIIFSAIRNNDRVGMMMFSNQEELHIPAKKGKNHGLRLLRELITYNNKKSGTNIKLALETFMKVTKKRSTVFLISDLLNDNFEKNIQMVNSKHDLIIIYIHSNVESDFILKGFVNLEDSENEETFLFSNSKSQNYKKNYNQRVKNNLEICRKSGVDVISIVSGESYLPTLRQFFKKRGA